MDNIDYENLTILLIVIITLLYLLIKYKKNKENFNDIKDDILTSTNETPLNIDTITILNNLNNKNLILNKGCENNIENIDITNSNLNNIIIKDIEYKDNKTKLNNNGFIYLNNEYNNIKNLNIKKKGIINRTCYDIKNINCKDLENNRKDNEFIDNIEELNGPEQTIYNDAYIYPSIYKGTNCINWRWIKK